MQSKFSPRLATLIALSTGFVSLVCVGCSDPAPASKEKPASAEEKKKPAEPAKPAEIVKTADPKAPAAAPTKEPVKAPEFALKDLDGKERKLSEFAGKYVVLEWTNYGCPFVKKHYGPGAMQALQKKYTDLGVIWLSICSSADGKEGHMSPEGWKAALAGNKAAPTAVLLDADGKIGHLYAARTTPDMRIIDPTGKLIYSGAIDDTPSPKADPKDAKNYVVQVLDAVLAGKEPPVAETKSYG